MKKVILGLMLSMIVLNSANADTIIVVDSNGVVKQQIYTQSSQPTVVAQSQPVVIQQPQVITQPVVVRETPVVNSYYYDPVATAAIAGVTGIVIGGALFGHGHGPHHGPRH